MALKRGLGLSLASGIAEALVVKSLERNRSQSQRALRRAPRAPCPGPSFPGGQDPVFYSARHRAVCNGPQE